MKKLVTFRFDPDLLAKAKMTAQQENRSLTNFVETVVKRAVDPPASGAEQMVASDPGKRP